jgi:dihydroorotase-like cyclic amidohydrolase
MVSSYQDVAALWEYLGGVDCFSAGVEGDLSMLVPVVLTLVSEGRLTLEDAVVRLCDNPRRILNLANQPDTFVEVCSL